MKAKLFTFILIFNSLLAMTQITLENAYSYSTSVSEINNGEFAYFLMDVPQKQCRIYNTYHVLQKTITLSVPEGYYLNDIKFVSRNLFNTDDLIELVYVYQKYIPTSTSYYYQYGLGIVNENGSQLLSLPDGGWAEINNLGGENKMLAYTYVYNPLGYYDVTTRVYALGGDADYIGYKQMENPLVFPNPAKDHIIISTNSLSDKFKGDFNLFTIDGLRLMTLPLIKGEDQSISTSSLGSGTYLYSINEGNKMIHSDKLIIR